jgi:serine/threonine protein kinase
MLPPDMTDESPSPDPELQHFGKYLLDQELARGGMSRVFRARLRGPGGFEKKLVVKQVLPDLARDPSFIELFVKEANTLVQMSHPNLVPVYELGVIDGVYFLAMEWVEGATIAELLEDGPLASELVAQVGAQIAEALRYAHERFQIVHRDVTPRNVIVDEAGHARLLDFGIAAPIGHEGKGELFGSPGYIAPEQLSGEPLGPESDLFSLGAVMYEALRGTPAFPEARRNATQRESYRPATALTDAEPTIAKLVMRLVSVERADRPKTAAEVANALRTWLAEHHPQGVEQELAERARKAHTARKHRPAPSAESPTAVSSGRIEVRSLAISPAMREMLQQATLRIERETPEPEPARTLSDAEEVSNDPEAHFVMRRFLRDIVVITMALFAAIWFANHRSPREDDVYVDSDPNERALSPTPLKGSPVAPEPGAPSTPANGLQPSAATPANAPQPAEAAPANGPQPSAAATPADAPQPPAANTPQPSAAGPATGSAAKTGYLTVSAAPWARVQLDGRDAGVTPRRHVPVKPGKHTLLLECPPLGKEAKVSFEVQPDQDLQVVVDLNETPAKVRVR